MLTTDKGHMMVPLPLQPTVRGMTAAEFLRSRGHRVEAADDIPGLFRVDGGPEITLRQLVHIARQEA